MTLKEVIIYIMVNYELEYSCIAINAKTHLVYLKTKYPRVAMMAVSMIMMMLIHFHVVFCATAVQVYLVVVQSILYTIYT